MQNLLYRSKKIDTVDILNIEKAKSILNNRKCIIVTGVTGQDGSHMVDYLLKNTTDYIIFGGVRRLSLYNHKNISHKRYNPYTSDLSMTNVSMFGITSTLFLKISF